MPWMPSQTDLEGMRWAANLMQLHPALMEEPAEQSCKPQSLRAPLQRLRDVTEASFQATLRRVLVHTHILAASADAASGCRDNAIMLWARLHWRSPYVTGLPDQRALLIQLSGRTDSEVQSWCL